MRQRLLRLSGWRNIIAALPLVITAYYTAYLVLMVPNFGFYATIRPNVMVVESVIEGHPAAQIIRPGDHILAVDGAPIRDSLWRPLFQPHRRAYVYLVERKGDQLLLEAPATALTGELLFTRTLGGMVALAMAAIATVVLLFASLENRDAWLLGLTAAAAAISLATFEAAAYMVPAAKLIFGITLPFAATGFILLAFVPGVGEPAGKQRLLGPLLLALAAVLAIGGTIEALQALAIEVSIFLRASELYLGFALLINPAILLFRGLGMPPSYEKRQSRLLIVLTAASTLPLVLLSLLPEILWGQPILPWEFSYALLLLIPISYAYVVYRWKYLQLDIFFSQAFTLILIGLFAAVVYSLVSFKLLANQPASVLWFNSMSVFLGVTVAVPVFARPFGRAVHRLIYDDAVEKGLSLATLSSELSNRPELETLSKVIQQLTERLEVRQAALYQSVNEGRLACLYSLRVDVAPSLSLTDDEGLCGEVLLATSGQQAEQFDHFPWAMALIPLHVEQRLVGLLVLGPRVPDIYFDANQIAHIRQAASVIAVAMEMIQLYEASRAMSRNLRQVQERERMHLASQIHDASLHMLTLAESKLEALSRRDEDARAARENIVKASRTLRDILSGLRPPLLDQGLDYAVVGVFEQFRERTDLNASLSIETPPDLWASQTIARALYQVLQEALNNIEKHAQAQRVWVRLYVQEQLLCLSVEDDGIGVPFNAYTRPDLLRGHHFGIAGMHDWAEEVNGRLILRPRDQGGTQITLEIPYDTGRGVSGDGSLI